MAVHHPRQAQRAPRWRPCGVLSFDITQGCHQAKPLQYRQPSQNPIDSSLSEPLRDPCSQRHGEHQRQCPSGRDQPEPLDFALRWRGRHRRCIASGQKNTDHDPGKLSAAHIAPRRSRVYPVKNRLLYFGLKETFGMKLILETRRTSGMTQPDVAQAAGGQRADIRPLERGEGSIRSLVAVIAVLDLCWSWAREMGPVVRSSPGGGGRVAEPGGSDVPRRLLPPDDHRP